MPNRRKDRLRKQIYYLRNATDMSLSEIANAVGLEGRQNVYYYLKTAHELFTKAKQQGDDEEAVAEAGMECDSDSGPTVSVPRSEEY